MACLDHISSMFSEEISIIYTPWFSQAKTQICPQIQLERIGSSYLLFSLSLFFIFYHPPPSSLLCFSFPFPKWKWLSVESCVEGNVSLEGLHWWCILCILIWSVLYLCRSGTADHSISVLLDLIQDAHQPLSVGVRVRPLETIISTQSVFDIYIHICLTSVCQNQVDLSRELGPLLEWTTF